MVGINEIVDLTASKEIVKACYSMPISRKKELIKKMLQTTIKMKFNIKGCTVESMQYIIRCQY